MCRAARYSRHHPGVPEEVHAPEPRELGQPAARGFRFQLAALPAGEWSGDFVLGRWGTF